MRRKAYQAYAGVAAAVVVLAESALGAPPAAPEWEKTIVKIDIGQDRKGRPRSAEIACRLPQRCRYVRGVIVAGSFGDKPAVQEAAARVSMGIMQGRVHARSGKEALKNIDAALDKWAEASGHPELRGAAILTASISAGVIWARNVAYAAPERVLGVVHIAGGNMHHGMVDERKTLAGVPLIAMNGELESCGPEGGIRPHLGLDTQWYMQTQQMLERRLEDPNNLMSMVVIPCRGHTAWHHELGALFVQKCAKYRLPKEKRDGSTPVKCVELKLEDGWLSDPNVKNPANRAAAWTDYRGDKTNAFWHLDRQMAQAVEKYHRNGIRPGQGRSRFRPHGLFDDLWPLGQRMDIPFKGHSPEAYEAAIREWILSKTDRKNHPIGTRDLIEREDGGWSYANWVHPAALPHLVRGIAAGLRKEEAGDSLDEAVCRRACIRILYAYDDVYRPIEDVIDKAGLPEAFKDRLRDLYAERLLARWPHGQFTPPISIRETQSMIAGWRWDTPMEKLRSRGDLAAAVDAEEARVRAVVEKECGAPPAGLADLLVELAQKDAKAGWAAVDKLAAMGRPAVPALVRTMEWAPQPAAMRAAGALGRMGAAGAPALPDLKRLAATGSRGTEMDSEICVKSLHAVDLIEKAMAETPAAAGTEGPSPSLKLVAASFFGTAEDDDIQGACGGPDGTIFIAGNVGARMKKLPGRAKPTRIGEDAENPRCGHGFVAQLSADGRRVLKYTEFGKGMVSCTTVQANDNGVYVAGFATAALEPLLKDVPGLIKQYPLRKEIALLEAGKWPDAVGEAKDTIPEAKHGQLGRYGAPFVLRLSAKLDKVECGTYLEGWQQVWAKHRYPGNKPRGAKGFSGPGWPTEYNWLPILVRLLKSGDPVVCHDGGYYRLLTDDDRKFAAENAERLVNENPTSHPPMPWRDPRSKDKPLPDRETRRQTYERQTLKRLGFYNVCDHLSRLSPDLDKRAWHTPIYTPATNPKVADKVRFGWQAPHHSNPRTHRMQLDEDENIFLCGWSATCTSCEPWWSFYLWRMSSETGELIWKVAEKDPMAGGRYRMFGSVADRGIGSLAVADNRLYYNSYSDGGWPGEGALHFSGSICRSDKATFELTAKARTGPCQWATDMHALPDEGLLTMGRGQFLRNCTEDAWQQDEPPRSPAAWLSLYSGISAGKLQRRFHTAVQGMWPYELARLPGNRFVLCGASWAELYRRILKEDMTREVVSDPNSGVAVVKKPMFDRQQGKRDGYFMLVACTKGSD